MALGNVDLFRFFVLLWGEGECVVEELHLWLFLKRLLMGKIVGGFVFLE